MLWLWLCWWVGGGGEVSSECICAGVGGARIAESGYHACVVFCEYFPSLYLWFQCYWWDSMNIWENDANSNSDNQWRSQFHTLEIILDHTLQRGVVCAKVFASIQKLVICCATVHTNCRLFKKATLWYSKVGWREVDMRSIMGVFYFSFVYLQSTK